MYRYMMLLSDSASAASRRSLHLECSRSILDEFKTYMEGAKDIDLVTLDIISALSVTESREFTFVISLVSFYTN